MSQGLRLSPSNPMRGQRDAIIRRLSEKCGGETGEGEAGAAELTRSEAVGAGIVMLGISLLCSIVGMLSVAIPAALHGELPKIGVGIFFAGVIFLLMLLTAILFITGVFMFATGAGPEPAPVCDLWPLFC